MLKLGGDGVKVPRLGGELYSSEAMSETAVLKLVPARLGGSGRATVARSAPTTAEAGPQD